MLKTVLFGIILLLGIVKCQLLPGYVCVPAGTCVATGGPGIDFRIVSPSTGGTNPCPSGQVPCLITPPANSCGRRSVTNVNTADGFATRGAWPWLVWINNQTGFAGAGVLINPNTVLTAAHKVVGNRATPNLIEIYVGITNESQQRSVTVVNIHPNFNSATLFNDIAVLTLNAPITPLPQELINTACLPTQGQSFVGQTCSVAGWGQTSFTIHDAPTMQLKQVNVTIVDYNTCYASMSNPSVLGTNVNVYLDPIGEICAGGQANRDACIQDGGAPLVCYVNNAYVVAGLVIWGKGCGQDGVYGVYVSVPNYISWIQSTIAKPTG